MRDSMPMYPRSAPVEGRLAARPAKLLQQSGFRLGLLMASVVAWFLVPSIADAANLYWVGADGANTSVASNWKTTNPAACGGGDAGAAPGASDTAIFDADCDNGATVNSAWNVSALDMQSGYAGTVTLGATLDVDGNLTITAGTLDVSTGNYGITVAGNFSNSGTFTARSGRVTFDRTAAGAQNINSGGSSFYAITVTATGDAWATIATNALTVTNDLTNTGAFLTGGLNWTMTGATFSNTGTVYFAGGETITGLTTMDVDSGTVEYSGDGDSAVDSLTLFEFGSTDYYNLRINATDGASDTFSLTAALKVAGNLTITAGVLDATNTNYGITVGGNWSNAGTFTARSGTVTFDATDTDNTINPGSSSFYGMTFNGSGGAWDLTTNNLTVTNALTITNGTFDLNGKNLTATGATFSNDATLRLQGVETVTGLTTDTNSGTVTYDGTGTYSSGLTAGDSYYNLTFNGSGGAWTLDAALDANNNLTITAGTLDVHSTGNYGITVAGNFSNSGTFTARSGRVTFDGTAVQNLNSGGSSFYAITNSNSTNWLTLATNALTVTNDFTNTGVFLTGGLNWTMTGATLSNTGTFYFAGSETLTGVTMDVDSGTVEYSGDGDAAVDSLTLFEFGSTDYYNLRINATDGASDTFASGAAKAIAGTFTITAGTYNANGQTTAVTGLTTVNGGTYTASTATQTFDGGLTISSGTFTGSSGTVDVNGTVTLSSGTLTAPSGTFTVSGDWTKSGGTFTSGSNTVTFDGTGTQTLTSGGTDTGSDFNNLTVNKSSGTLSLATNALDVDGTLTISSGTFSPGSLAVTTATLTVSGGTFTGGAGAVTVSGTTTTSSGTLTAPTGTLTTAALTVSGGTFTGGAGTTDVNGAVTVSSGTLTAPSDSGSFTISGNFTHSGGTFTHNSGTVTLDGTDQTLSGATTFNNLTKTVTTARTLTFPSGSSSTQTIAGTLTLKGAAGALLSLRSSTDGTQARIDAQGSRSVEYLDVKDSYNTNATTVSCTTGCVNSGNNTGWAFLVDTAQLALDTPADGALLNTVKPTFSFTRVAAANVDAYALLLDTDTSSAKTIALGAPVEGSLDVRAQVTARRSGDRISAEVTDSDLLGEGSHTWKIRATAGGTNTDSAKRSFTIDITKPTVGTITVTPTAEAGTDDFGTSSLSATTVRATVTDNHELKEIELSLAQHRTLFGAPLGTLTIQRITRSISGTSAVGEFSLGMLAEGRYTITLTARDKAGNERVETKTLRARSADKTASLEETIEKATEALKRGEAPAPRAPVEFHLETLEKEAKIRRAKEAENLQVFLGSLLGQERLERLDRTIADGSAAMRGRLRAFALAAKDRVLAALGFTRTQLALVGEFLAAAREETAVILAGASETLRTRAPDALTGVFEEQARERAASLARLRTQQAAHLQRIQGVVPQLVARVVLRTERARGRVVATLLTARQNRLALAAETARPLDRAIAPVARFARRVGLGTRLAVEVISGKHEELLRISNVGITALTSTSAVIAWETNYTTRGQVNWGETPSFGALEGTEGGQFFTDAPATSHSITLGNLTPAKKYYFEVLATDFQGRQSFDAYYGFTTPLEVSPLTGPTPGD